MKPFEFIAVGSDGREVRGREFAASEVALDRDLERRGLTLTSARASAGTRVSRHGRLKSTELLMFTHQLATLVGSGVPLVEGLEGIAARMQRPSARLVVEGMVLGLREGKGLSEAMDAYPAAFPNVYRASVRAGEASGALDHVLTRLARHLEWTRTMRAMTMQALIYPAILFCALVGLVLLLLYFVLPRLVTLFPGGRDSLPMQTQVVMNSSDFVRNNGLVLLLVAVGSAVAFAALTKRKAGREALHRVLLAIPKVGAVAAQLAASRFASTASTLQAAGCDVFTTLSVAGDTCGNAALAASFERVAKAARRGSTLTQALERETRVDPLLVQLVSVGERSGDLDGCLDRLVAYYDDEVPRRVKRFLSLLEPAMLLAAAFVVAFILLAALLPVFKLYETLG